MSTPATFCTSSASNVNNCFLPRVATHCFKLGSYSKRIGPLKGEDHQICRLGVCLFSTQVPCSPIRMLRTPCCEDGEEERDRLKTRHVGETYVYVNMQIRDGERITHEPIPQSWMCSYLYAQTCTTAHRLIFPRASHARIFHTLPPRSPT